MIRRKQPGTTSTTSLVVSAIAVGAAVVVMIGGHAILAYGAWAWFNDESGMETITELFGVPEWPLWLCMLAALAIDVWVVYSIREERRNIRRR